MCVICITVRVSILSRALFLLLVNLHNFWYDELLVLHIEFVIDLSTDFMVWVVEDEI